MKRFDYAKPKFSHLLHNATLLTFFCKGKKWKNKREKLETCLWKVLFHFGGLNFITRFLQLSLLEN
jgi:hypothetical protein